MPSISRMSCTRAGGAGRAIIPSRGSAVGRAAFARFRSARHGTREAPRRAPRTTTSPPRALGSFLAPARALLGVPGGAARLGDRLGRRARNLRALAFAREPSLAGVPFRAMDRVSEGTVLAGKYALVTKLGQGGMGAV